MPGLVYHSLYSQLRSLQRMVHTFYSHDVFPSSSQDHDAIERYSRFVPKLLDTAPPLKKYHPR